MKRRKQQLYRPGPLTIGRGYTLATGVALASGVVVGWVRYKQPTEGLKRQIEAKKGEQRENKVKTSHTYEEALKGGLKSQTYVNKLQKPNGAADLQWVALSRLFRHNNIPFREPYIDVSTGNLIGQEALDRISPTNEDLVTWNLVRKHAKFVIIPADIKERAERHLMYHVNRELRAEREIHRLDLIKQDVYTESIQMGAATSAGLMVAVIIAHITIVAKRKVDAFIRKIRATRLARRREDEQKVYVPAAPKAETITKPNAPPPSLLPSLLGSEVIGPEPVTPLRSEIEELKDIAKERLSEILTREQVNEIFDVLGEKLNKKVLRHITQERYGLLIVHIKDSRDRFSFNVDEILTKLNGQNEEGKQRDDSGPVNGVDERVRDHPLMQFKSGGWSRAEFHRVLRHWGFELVPGGNDGHFHVTYKGEKVRNGDGRPLIVTHPTKARAASKGMVSAVLKACAEHLVRVNEG